MKRGVLSTHNGRPHKRQRSPDSSNSETDYDSCPSSGIATPYPEVVSTATTPATPLTPRSTSRYPSDLKTIACTYTGCKKTFNRPAKLEQHLRSHANVRPFVCSYDQCDKTFLRQSHLSHHVKSAHLDTRQYVCQREDCGKRFVTATRLKRHEALHEGRDKFRCQAPGCGQTFRKHNTLEKHIISVHEQRNPFICNYLVKGKACGVALDSAAKLKVHCGRVHGEVRFWCQVCEPARSNKDIDDAIAERPGFTTYRDLQTHMKTVHRPICGQCGLQCSSQSKLKTHTEIQHGEVGVDERRTHVCPNEDCGLAFTARSVLQSHIRAKHEGKQFICGDPEVEIFKKKGGWDRIGACGQPFLTKGNLERHISTVHLGTASRKGAKQELKGRKRRAGRRQSDPLLRLTGENHGNMVEGETPWYDHRFSMAWEDMSQGDGLAVDHDTAIGWTLGGKVPPDMAALEEGIHFGGEGLEDGQDGEWLEDELEMQKLIS